MSALRTSRGRPVDMTALAKDHEDKVAISPGSSKMNARGDLVDEKGKVLVTVQDRSRLQQRHSEPVETAGVGGGAPSDASIREPRKPEEPAAESAPQPAKKAKKPKKAESSKVVREEEKERADGSRFVEIEYEDGSFETKELES